MTEQITTNEIMDFLKDNMVTKEEFMAGIARLDSKIDTKIDALREEMQIEFAKIHSEIADIRADLEKLEKAVFEDTTAAAKEISELQDRVKDLEIKVSRLEAARA